MLMIKTYFVFDLDNTLIKTNRANNNSYIDAIFAVTGKIIQIRKSRFTRADLSSVLPHLPAAQISEIIKMKEKLYSKHLKETSLNLQLVKCLKLLKCMGKETILLTESRKKRALQVCDNYAITEFFSQTYCLEDYGNGNKYQFLETLKMPMDSIVLFENERKESRKAMRYGIPESQIITIKF